MEEAIELQSGYELSDPGSEEINRWLDDLDEERLDDAAEGDMEDDGGQEDSGGGRSSQEESGGARRISQGSKPSRKQKPKTLKW